MIVNVLDGEIDVSDIRYVTKIGALDSTDLYSSKKEAFKIGFNDGNYLHIYGFNVSESDLYSARRDLIRAWKQYKED